MENEDSKAKIIRKKPKNGLLTSEEMRLSKHHYQKKEIAARALLDKTLTQYGSETTLVLTAPEGLTAPQKELWGYAIQKCCDEGHPLRQTSLPSLKRYCLLQDQFDKVNKSWADEGSKALKEITHVKGKMKWTDYVPDPRIAIMASLNKSILALEIELGMTMKAKKTSEKKKEDDFFK